MSHFELFNFSIQNLPKINGICIHTSSKDISILCKFMNLSSVSMKNRVTSRESCVCSKDAEIILGKSHDVSSIEFIRTPLLLMFMMFNGSRVLTLKLDLSWMSEFISFFHHYNFILIIS
jgi:hypothetical protein